MITSILPDLKVLTTGMIVDMNNIAIVASNNNETHTSDINVHSVMFLKQVVAPRQVWFPLSKTEYDELVVLMRG